MYICLSHPRVAVMMVRTDNRLAAAVDAGRQGVVASLAVDGDMEPIYT